MKCEKCSVETSAPLCEEHFYEAFEKHTGIKSEWVYNEKKQEWESVYKGIGFKQ